MTTARQHEAALQWLAKNGKEARQLRTLIEECLRLDPNVKVLAIEETWYAAQRDEHGRARPIDQWRWHENHPPTQ